jgi:hypothetical protein
MQIALPIATVQPWNGASVSIPPGEDYAFQIVEAKQEASSQKGTPQLRIDVVVLNDGDPRGRKGVFWYALTEKAAGRLRSLFDAVGGVPLDGTGSIANDQDFVNKQFVADVINDPYEKTNPATGQITTLDRSKIQNERSLAAFQQQGPSAPAQPVAPQFQQPVPQQAAAPMPHAAAPAPAAPAPRPQGNNTVAFPRPVARQ